LKNIAKIAAKVGGINHGFRFLQVPVLLILILDQCHDARGLRRKKSTRWIAFRNSIKLENQCNFEQSFAKRQLNQHTNNCVKAKV
jgi:hypothetical protein